MTPSNRFYLRARTWIAAAIVGLGAASAAQGAAGAPETATFAGGCFWCVESDFDTVPGVLKTTSGYTGGHLENPTYKQVTAGGTGHREAVQIEFDPSQVGYAELLEIFWRSVDPTDGGGQFCDRGESYTTAVFAEGEEQQSLAMTSKAALEASETLGQSVVTPIEAAGPFYPAEEYHQDYYSKNPIRYRYYRLSCGRDAKVEKVWGAEAHRGLGKH